MLGGSLLEAVKPEPESKLRKEVEKAQKLGVEVIDGLDESMAKLVEEIEKARQTYLFLVGEYGEAQREVFEATAALTLLEQALPRKEWKARHTRASKAALTFHVDERDICKAFGQTPVFPSHLVR
jgi:hypothetical protein